MFLLAPFVFVAEASRRWVRGEKEGGGAFVEKGLVDMQGKRKAQVRLWGKGVNPGEVQKKRETRQLVSV